MAISLFSSGIPLCAVLGYFLPHDGTNDIAWGLISFDSIAAYERCRGRLKTDAEGQAGFAQTNAKRFILRASADVS